MAKIFLAVLFSVLSVSNTTKLNVVVKNIQVGKGSVKVEVYNNDKDFLKKNIAWKTMKASSQSMEFTFDLSEGVYAVAVYQDLNENKKLDKGWFGIPTEPYGLSNNFVPVFEAPEFNDCKFILTDQKTITVNLK